APDPLLRYDFGIKQLLVCIIQPAAGLDPFRPQLSNPLGKSQRLTRGAAPGDKNGIRLAQLLDLGPLPERRSQRLQLGVRRLQKGRGVDRKNIRLFHIDQIITFQTRSRAVENVSVSATYSSASSSLSGRSFQDPIPPNTSVMSKAQKYQNRSQLQPSRR